MTLSPLRRRFRHCCRCVRYYASHDAASRLRLFDALPLIRVALRYAIICAAIVKAAFTHA